MNTTRRLLLVALLSAAALFPDPAPAQEKWVEVRSPNFIVVSDADDKQARRVAEEFEQFRAAFQAALPQARVDPGKPVFVMASREVKTLQRWLPGFWEQGQIRPTGAFIAGDERHYAAVQIGLSGPEPYHNLYHEYVHLLNQLNFQQIPVWLNEGLAEVYSTAVIGEHTVEFGRPDQRHLRLLRRNRSLPLETLLQVDHSSPQYSEAEKATVFYAQSWALTHLLLFGDPARSGQVESYIRRFREGASATAAAEGAFGDLKDLEKQLLTYSRQPSFQVATIPVPTVRDPSTYQSRELSLAEAAARRGDFLLHTHRPAEARQALEEALKLDENEPLTIEALANLALREDDRESAFRWLLRAIDAGSQSHLTHYYFAMLLAERATDPEQAETAEEHLERAIELNPGFAAAHAALSSFYAMRPATLPEALSHAEVAVTLEPNQREFQLNLGRILLQMQRVEEAISIGKRALEMAATDEERRSSENFLASARKYQQDLAAWKKAEEEARLEAEERRKRRESEALARAAEPPPAPPPPSQPTWGVGPRRRVTGSAVQGWISGVTCNGKAMDLQLNLGPYLLRLHSSDYFNMGFLTAGWIPPEDFDPCKDLKGNRATVIYRAVEGKSYAGEVLALQIQK